MDEWFRWWMEWWGRTFLYALLAAFGGFLGYVMRSLEDGVDVVYTRAVIEGLAASFVGLLVMLMCTALSLSEHWTGVIVGVSGWLGANASIRMLEKKIFKQLGISHDSKDESDG